MSYKAWIRLINLPFECWTVDRVAALVGDFGRFIKADEITKAMTDLRFQVPNLSRLTSRCITEYVYCARGGGFCSNDTPGELGTGRGWT